MTEERFDIYNEEKKLTGRTMVRKGSFLHAGEYCLIVLGIVRRPDGKFLITRRAMDKHWAPGVWEVPGGGVRAGETSMEGLVREMTEETGLPMEKARIRLIDTYSNVDLVRGDNYFVDIYDVLIEFEEKDVQIEKDEATAFGIEPWTRLTELGEAGQFMHYARIKTALEKAGLL